MSSQPETLFDSIESAREYVRLLLEAINEAKTDLEGDIAAAAAKPDRRLEALRLVHYNVEKLSGHLHSSSRLLNDLRSLRRLLLEERSPAVGKRTGTEG